MSIQQEKRTESFDKLAVIPAIIFIAQSIPWISSRIRMRFFAPFMLLYVIAWFIRKDARFLDKLQRQKMYLFLISFIAYSFSFVFANWKFYGEFMNHIFVTQVFGLFSAFAFATLYSENKIREIKLIVKIVLVALLLASLMGGNYLAEEHNRDVIRAMTGGGASDFDLVDAMNSGVGGFGFVYAIGLLVPALLYALYYTKGNIHLKCVIGLSSISFLIYAYRAGFSILMSTICFGAVFYLVSTLFTNYKRYRALMYLFIVLLLVTTLFPTIWSFLQTPILGLADLSQNENYVNRLKSVADTIGGVGGDEYAKERTGMMWVSWKLFCKYPLFGASDREGLIGGHSHVFDFLAEGGIILFMSLPICVFLYSKYMSSILAPLTKRGQYMVGTYLFMVIIVSLLNPLVTPIVYNNMFFLLPGLSLFFRDNRLNYMNTIPSIRR